MTESKKKPVTEFVSHRAQELSTYAGLAAVVLGGLFGAQHPTLNDPGFYAAATAVLSGLVNIFTKERKAK